MSHLSLVLKSSEKIALRFFVVDDSGSMTINDGQRVAKVSSCHCQPTCHLFTPTTYNKPVTYFQLQNIVLFGIIDTNHRLSPMIVLNYGSCVDQDEKGITKLIKCSRWKELSETVKFLAGNG